MSLPCNIPIDTSLRPYQQKAKTDIYSAWNLQNNIMFQMPTGTGKTRLFTSIIKDIIKYDLRSGEKILVVAHRKELIDQIHESLTKYGIYHSVYVGPKDKRDSRPPVLVTSIQTFAFPSNSDERNMLRDILKYIIIDEAHHAAANSYRKLWTCFKSNDVRRLGVTATPYRLSKEGFTKQFGPKLLQSMPIKDFIKQGWLAPYEYISLKQNSQVQRAVDSINEFDSFGDYREAAMERTMDQDHIRAQLLDSYRHYAWGKKGIIYTINRAHSVHVCQKYRSAGLRVESIDANTPKSERERVVNKFKRGQLDIIVNVNIFSEGFDCPDIEFIQLARPTMSLGMYLQQVGRGLRITKDKRKCIILDNVGLYNRFGLPNANRRWQYHYEGKEDEVKPTKQQNKTGTGNSTYYEPDYSEGSEQMTIIQQLDENGTEAAIPQQDKIFDYTTTKSTLPRSMRLTEITQKLKDKGYTPKGYLMVADREDEIYDVRIDKYGDATVDKVVIRDNSVTRLLVASYKPETKPHDAIQSFRFQDIQTIKHLSGWSSLTEVRNTDGTVSTCNFLGEETNLNDEVNHLLKMRIDNDIHATDNWNCSFDKSKYDIIKGTLDNYDIKRHKHDGTIEHVSYITKGTDMYRLFESKKDIEIMRHDGSGYYVAFKDGSGFKLLRYNQSGTALDEVTKNILPSPYLSNIILGLSDASKAILEYLKKHPSSMAKEIANGTGYLKGTVNNRLYGELTSKNLVSQSGYTWKAK